MTSTLTLHPLPPTERDDGAPAKDALVRAEGVSVMLGGKPVLRSVTLHARRGEIVGLTGPNGSGKSTLLRALAGLQKPSGGGIWLNGEALGQIASSARARRIAYMPQSAERHPFTALEAVLMGRYPHMGRFEIEGPEDRDIAFAAMRRAGVEEFAGRQIDTLSGGERQRVLLARALAQQPDVLLLDEPTAALDLKHRLSVMDTVREEAAARDVAVVAAMHDLSLAGRYCDRLLLLDAGRIIAAGAPEEVLTSENLRAAFGVETVIEPDSVTGRPQVTLLGASSLSGPESRQAGTESASVRPEPVEGPQARPRRMEEGVRVHIICGAGSGRDLMHQLVSAGYTVTACVLGQGDTDRETAERLKVEFVPSPPFSAVTDGEHARHAQLVEAADCVLLCDMAVGRNNLPNLRAAAGAKRLLIVNGRPFAELDYTGGEAARVFGPLAQHGQRVARPDVLRTLARDRAAVT